MSATIDDIQLPPDPYNDVYDGAACAGMYGDFSVLLCNVCPVAKRCGDLFEDLQFGSLNYGEEHGRLSAMLTGIWDGHEYVWNGVHLLKDGERWYVRDRPSKPGWAR